MLKINKLKPVTILSAPLANQMNICFSLKILGKYGANRFRSQFVSLVFRTGHKMSKETGTAAKTSIPVAVNNNRYFNEYKPIINFLTGAKEPVYLNTVKDKPVPHYIYINKLLYKNVFFGEKPESVKSLIGKSYKNNIGLELIKNLDKNVKAIADKRKDFNYKIADMHPGKPAANEDIFLIKQIYPNNRISKYSTTALKYILHHNSEEIHVNDSTKSYYTNLPSVLNSVRTKKITPHIPVALPLDHIDVNTENRHPGINKIQVEPIHFEQSEELNRNLKPDHQQFKYRRLNNITGLSNVYNPGKNILVQTAEIQRKVTENAFHRLNRTDIHRDMVLKELYYIAAPGLIKPSEKQDRVAVDGWGPMPTQKNTLGFLQKGKDSGLILYKPKREKPPAAENQIPEDALTVGKEVYAKTVTSSKPVKVSIADNAEEVNLIAEKVYGIIEKKMEIQKDRRGLR
ncbi:MAG: hypothetical protein K0R50_1535 [Eubacterium sp.]|jgi:hypothetical protein|nr:hypothetical protein [Eubacterium sp.]